MSLWSSLCFAFSGFEISSMVGQEVYEPAEDHSAQHRVVGHRDHGDLHPELGVGARRGSGKRAGRAQRHRRCGGARRQPSRLRGTGRLHRPAAVHRIDRRHQLLDRRRLARAVRRGRRRRDAVGVREAASEVPNAACCADRAGDRHHGVVPRERVPLGRRRQDDDPGGLRHHGEPHHPDLLPAVSVFVRGVHPAAIDGQVDAGGREHDRAAGWCCPAPG